MRCPVSGRLTVQKRSLVTSLTGSLEGCGGLPKVSPIRCPSAGVKGGRLIQRVIPRRNPAPQKRPLISARPTRPQCADRLNLLLHRNRKPLKERTVTRLLLGTAPTAERGLGSCSTKGCILRRCLIH